MKKLIWLAAITTITIAVSSCDNKKSKNYNQASTEGKTYDHKTNADDQGVMFIMAANEAGLTEINAAAVAERNSKNPRVISFAKMMIADHIKAGNELKSIAKDKQVAIIDTIGLDHKMMITDLSKKTGPDFDKAYMQMMANDHAKVIELFHEVSTNKSKALSDFADKTLPTLKMHLDSAKAISASLK